MGRMRVAEWALVLSALPMGACSSSGGASAPDATGDVATNPSTDATREGAADAPRESAPVEAGGAEAGADAGEAGTGAPTARFNFSGTGVPNLLDVPFPSDIYRSGGKVIDPIPGAAAVITGSSTFITHELGKLDGFSRVAQALFTIDDPTASDGLATLDPASLPVNEAACVADASAVFVLDLAATGAAARVACRAAFHDDRPIGAKGYKPVLAVGPGRGVVLAEGHQYAVVITSRLKTTAGLAVGASKDFLALTGAGASSAAYGAPLTTANALLASALATDHASIVDIAPFTTNTSTKVLLQMRTNLESVPVPTLAWDQASMGAMGAVKFAAKVGGVLPAGFTASLDDLFGTVTAPPLADGTDDPNADLPVRAHDKIAAVGTAVFQAENYLSPAGNYGALDQATFTFDATGKVVPDATHPKAPIWVTFFVPTTAMPAAGYPVVIVQHGLGESRAIEAFNLANTFAKEGWMVAAIDSVTFGARAAEAVYQVDKVNNFAAGGGAYSGPDGVADPVGSPPSTNGLNDLFGVLLDLGAMRDQFRQAEIDTSQLARVLASNPDLSPLKAGPGATAPKIDGTKIAYFGNSLGSIQGTVAAAIEPLIQTWVFNVGGGGLLLELADHSPTVAADLAFAGLNFGATGDRLNESHPLINLIQTLFDPADALSFGGYLVKSPATVNGAALKPRNVLQIEVVYDEFVPNESNESLARAIGLGFATPNVGTNSGVTTLAMLKDPTLVPDRLPLTAAAPDSLGLIHDFPAAGTTAVLVQTMPGRHGDNFQAGLVTHSFAIPYNQPTSTPFVSLGSGSGASDPPFQVTCSYAAQQAMAVRFLSDAFSGKVPNVTGFTPPVRDFDGDGNPDSTDPDPNNPQVK